MTINLYQLLLKQKEHGIKLIIPSLFNIRKIISQRKDLIKFFFLFRRIAVTTAFSRIAVTPPKWHFGEQEGLLEGRVTGGLPLLNKEQLYR